MKWVTLANRGVWVGVQRDMGMTAVVLGAFWLAFLIPFVPLWRDHAVTRFAFWSAVVVGIAAGLVRSAPGSR